MESHREIPAAPLSFLNRPLLPLPGRFLGGGGGNLWTPISTLSSFTPSLVWARLVCSWEASSTPSPVQACLVCFGQASSRAPRFTGHLRFISPAGVAACAARPHKGRSQRVPRAQAQAPPSPPSHPTGMKGKGKAGG